MDLFYAILSALGSIITIIVWARNNLREKPKALVYPIFIVLLTTTSTYYFIQNTQMREIKLEARLLVSKWPKVKDLSFESKGAEIGIILSGLSFLEKHKSELPDTYQTARELLPNRVNNFKASSDTEKDHDLLREYKESELLKDTAGAMIELINSFTK